MALLEKIRVKLGIFITILIALALLSFIIDPNTLSSAMQMVSKSNKVGEMNGNSISYQDYFTKVENTRNLFENLGQADTNTEEAQMQLRDLVWNDYFDDYVFIPQTKKAGIAVGQEELYDLMQGSNISQILAQQGSFLDAEGNFSREAFSTFVQSIEQDQTGLYSQYYDYLEDAVYRQQLYQKYSAALANSSVLNSLELNQTIEAGNTTADVDFIMLPIGLVTDTTVNVSVKEAQKYYNDRKDIFTQIANRDAEYVIFEVVPSEQDIEEARAEFDQLYEEFRDAENMKNFLTLNSDNSYNELYFSKEEIESESEEFAQFAFPARGQSPVISDIFEGDGFFSAARLIAKKNVPDSASISYVLVSSAAEATADSLINVLKNKGEVTEMQDFGWLTQSVAYSAGIPEFCEALDAKAGDVLKVKLPSMQAIAVIKVLEKTKPIPKAALAILTKNVVPSDDTYRDYLMQATDLADRSEGKFDKFAQIVREEQLPVIPLSHVTRDTRAIGQAENAREVVRWMFDAKKGDVSDVITVDNKYYFVVAVTQVRKEGQIPFEELKDDINTILSSEKQGEKMAADIAEKIEGLNTLEEMSEVLNAAVSHEIGVSFAGTTTALDPRFVGAVAGAPKGKVVGPVTGSVGVYLFEVTDVQSGSYYTEDDVKSINAQYEAFRIQQIANILNKQAKTVDNRAKFF
ncbi:MAG: SurA N-terminal domain-containing protein [Bacteroidales bacterium]|nr:SurA N-terminal domain-containing protein [Bacteroidales bacterium]